MTIVTLNPVADSWVYHDAENSSLSTLRAAAGNNIVRTNASSSACGLETTASTTTGNFRYMSRGIFTFDTRDIPEGATIVSATLTFTRSGGNNQLGDFEICLVSANPASATSHAATDYANVGETEFAPRVTFSEWGYLTEHTYTLNGDGRAYIKKGQYTSFAVRTGWDLDNSFTGTWGAYKWSEVLVYASESSTDKPVLTIEYTESQTVTLNPVHDSTVWHDQDNVSLSTLRAAAGNNIYATYASTWACGLESSSTCTTGNFRWLRRSLFTFDTRDIPEGVTIVSATLTFTRSGGNNKLGDFEICLVSANPATPTYHNETDYANVGSTEFAPRVKFSEWGYLTEHTYTLNAAGKSSINKGGYTTFALRTGWDVDNSFTGTWVASYWSELHTFFNESTTGKPTLVITYSTPSDYHELSCAIGSNVDMVGSVSLGTIFAQVWRKQGSESYTQIGLVDWADGSFVDTHALVVGTIYRYKTRKVQPAGSPGRFSGEDSIQYDGHHMRLFETGIGVHSSMRGTLDTTEETTIARVERAAMPLPYSVYDFVDWTEGRVVDTGPFSNGNVYAYRVVKVTGGVDGGTSNEVSVLYNGPGPMEFEGTIPTTSTMFGTASIPDMTVIERKVGTGDFEILGYTPTENLSFTDVGPLTEQTYTYRVRHRVAGTYGEYTNEVIITWIEPNWVEIAGSVDAVGVFNDGWSLLLNLTSTVASALTFTGSLGTEYVIASTIAAKLSDNIAITRVMPFGSTIPVALTGEAALTVVRSVSAATAASSTLSGSMTRFVRLDTEIDSTTRLTATLRKWVSAASDIASTGSIVPALLGRVRTIAGTVETVFVVSAPHLGVSATRLVVAHVAPITSETDESYLSRMLVSSFVATLTCQATQSHIQRQDVTSTVARITAVAEGYIYAKSLLELMIGEGPFFITVEEMPLETEYTVSDYEEEKSR